MADKKKVMMALGAVFSVALLLSVAVIAPFSVDNASANDELTDEEKQAYIEAKIAELTADTNDQMLAEYGISLDEYESAVEFLTKNPLVLTTDDNGDIVADSLDSVEAGRCLWESGFNGNNYNIYIDSVTWSTFVFFFSNDFVNLAVDDYTHKESDAYNEAQNNYDAMSAAYDNAVIEYQNASNAYNVALAESQDAEKQYQEAKKVYDAAVKESEKADANVDALTSAVNQQQTIVDQKQAEIDNLKKECDEKQADAQVLLDNIIDSMADAFCNMTLFIETMYYIIHLGQASLNGLIGDFISKFLDDICFGTYVKDAGFLAACGLTETALNAKYMDSIIKKFYDKIGTNLIVKSDILSFFAKEASVRFDCMKYLCEKIMNDVWSKGINAAIVCENKSIGYETLIDNANKELTSQKENLGKSAENYKKSVGELKEDLSKYSARCKEIVSEKLQLTTNKTELEKAVKIADEKNKDMLNEEKDLVKKSNKKESKKSIFNLKENIKETKGKALSVAKNAKNTAWESLKTAHKGLTVAKELAKKSAAEAGKVACKAALRTALACFGAVSIIIDIIIALLMKFIIDGLGGSEPANGIEISVKVQDSFCIWGCRIWYPVFPSLNYIRAQ